MKKATPRRYKYNSEKNIRVTRELEKQKVSRENNIAQRLQDEDTKVLPEKPNPKPKRKPKSFQEAIEMYFD